MAKDDLLELDVDVTIDDDYTNDDNHKRYNKIKPDTLIITTKRYNELSMLYNTNRMLTSKVNELLIQISELQLLLKQKVITKTKKNLKAINDCYFK
jgi:hypothetical protein